VFETFIVSPKSPHKSIGVQRFIKVLIRVNLLGANGILTAVQVHVGCIAFDLQT